MNDFFYGSIGGVFGTCISHPIDTLRIQIQNNQKINFTLKNLYKGIRGPLFGITLEKTIIFGIYNKTYEITNNKYLSGYFAGICSILFITPIEKYKIHYQTTKHKKFLFQNLYRGIIPTLFREPPGYLLYFSSYDYLRKRNENNIVNHFWMGGLSGCFSWIFIYPADIIKTYQQKYERMSIKEIHQKIMKLKFKYYQGFSMALLRAFPLHGGVFLGYELAKKLFL